MSAVTCTPVTGERVRSARRGEPRVLGAVQGSGAALLASVPTEVLSWPPLTLTPALHPTDWPALVTSGRAQGARGPVRVRAHPNPPPSASPVLQPQAPRGVARHWSR